MSREQQRLKPPTSRGYGTTRDDEGSSDDDDQRRGGGGARRATDVRRGEEKLDGVRVDSGWSHGHSHSHSGAGGGVGVDGAGDHSGALTATGSLEPLTHTHSRLTDDAGRLTDVERRRERGERGERSGARGGGGISGEERESDRERRDRERRRRDESEESKAAVVFHSGGGGGSGPTVTAGGAGLAPDTALVLRELGNGSFSDTRADLIPEKRKTKIYSKYRKKVRRKTHLTKSERERLRVPAKITRRSSREQLYTEADEALRVSAFCTCDRFELADIIEFLETIEGFDSITLYADVLQVKQKKAKRDIFVFSYGCVCFFNMPEAHESRFLRMIKRFEVGSLPIDQHQFEDFEFVYGTSSTVSNDQITLSSHSSLEKLSVSFALAQCVKLSIYEERISQEMEENKRLPMTLARTGSVGLSHNSVSKKIGKLFIERNNVNLHFDVLDTPEFFWEQDKYKPVYDRLFNYLELNKRVELLNKRLDIMKELLDMLADEQQNAHATKLEWIIIWLIVFEVIIMVIWDIIIKDILGFF